MLGTNDDNELHNSERQYQNIYQNGKNRGVDCKRDSRSKQVC